MPFNLVIVAILLGGWLFGRLFTRLGLPSVLGMVVWGLCLGMVLRGRLPPLLVQLEPFLKSFALIVILLRACLGINRSTLRKAGLTAGLMTFLPCMIEGGALMVLFHLIFGFSWPVAGLTAFMLAAVSPAVIVPSMLHLKDEGYGRQNEVPTIILAGASVDDVFAITMFTVFLQAATSGGVQLGRILLAVPLSLFFGIVPGIIVGFFLLWLFRRQYANIRATEKVLVLLMIAVVLVQIGDWAHTAALGGVALSYGLAFRSLGVLIATIGSDLSRKERLFCMIAYFPKATVQAALGGVALSYGLAEDRVCRAVCFPYAQHYIADSPGCRTYVRDAEDMVAIYRRLAEKRDMKTFSTAGAKTMLLISVLASLLANIVLLTLLFLGL